MKTSELLLWILPLLMMIAAQESRPAATQPVVIPPPIAKIIELTVDETMRSANSELGRSKVTDIEARQMESGRIGSVPRGETMKVEQTKNGSRYVFKSQKAKDEAIAQRRELAQLQRDKAQEILKTHTKPSIWMSPLASTVGMMGALEMTTQPRYENGGTITIHHTMTIMQIQDDRNMLVTIESADNFGRYVATSEPIWIRGASTSGLVDGKEIKMGDAIFIVADPVRYTNTMGAQTTVACLELVDVAKWQAEIDAEVDRQLAVP